MCHIALSTIHITIWSTFPWQGKPFCPLHRLHPFRGVCCTFSRCRFSDDGMSRSVKFDATVVLMRPYNLGRVLLPDLFALYSKSEKMSTSFWILVVVIISACSCLCQDPALSQAESVSRTCYKYASTAGDVRCNA